MSDWKSDLAGIFEEKDAVRQEQKESELARFISGVAVPAFQQLTTELEKHGRDVNLRMAMNSAALIVHHNGEEEMTYRIQGRTFPNGVLPYAEVRFRERKGLKFIRVETMFRSGKPDYTLADITETEIIRNFLDHYKRHVRND